MDQFYRLTLADAISKYQAGDLTAKGLVHFYILIKCKPEWKIRLEHEKVCSELGISKAAFYNAISRLRSEGSIEWEAPRGILVSLSISPSVCECGLESTIVDSQSTIVDSQSTIVDSQSTIVDSKSPEPSSDKGCSDSPDLLLDPYQIFFSSLSNSERENFLKFSKKKATQLPKPPELPLKWIEKNFEELRSQWEKENGVVKNSKNWESDPRRLEWLDKIRSLGFAAFICENGNLDEERQQFYEWANSKNLIWGDL
ncbi:MAG: hypothetical protein ACIWVG_04590 [Gloeotrichia echinulata HAB0833]